MTMTTTMNTLCLRLLLPLLLFSIPLLPAVRADERTEIPEDFELLIKQRLFDSAYYSWELGTLTQVILQYDAPSLSPFQAGSIPPDLSTLPLIVPTSPSPSNTTATNSTTNLNNNNEEEGNDGVFSNITYYNTTLLTPLYTIAQTIISSLVQSYGGTNTIPKNTSQPLLINDGSSGDPASLGMVVALFNWTGWGDEDVWGRVLENQVNYLRRDVPRTEDGAISHRGDEVQLWSDFIYMVPPFLAYYAALQNDLILLQESYTQISLYRSHLHSSPSSENHNLWKHIVFGSNISPDERYWATGNGWVCMGMLKVLGVILNGGFAESMSGEVDDLVSWVLEVQGGMVRVLDNSTYTFTNYLTPYPSSSEYVENNFQDSASSSLFAYSVYTLSNLLNIHTYIPEAELIRIELSTSWSKDNPNDDEKIPDVSPESDRWYKHFDQQGYLTPVVNPRSFTLEGSQSAEGQAFFLGMQSAYREWRRKGSLNPPLRPVGNGAVRTVASMGVVGVGAGVLGLLVLMVL